MKQVTGQHSPFSSREQLMNHFSLEMYSRSTGKNLFIQYPYGSNFLTGLNPLWVFETIKRYGPKSGPFMMYFDATNKCDDHCPMCFLYKNRKKTGLETQINIDKAFGFLNKILSLSPFLKSAVIGGPGEPLEYLHFAEIIEYLERNGLSIHIYSSGNGKIKKYVNDILKHVRLFRVSLDASCSDTYKLTHGKKDFDDRIKYIKLLVKERELASSSTILGVHFVIQRHNYHEIEEFAEMAKQMKLDYVEYVWESYYTVRGLSDIESEIALSLLEKIQHLADNEFSIISPLDRKKHQLTVERVSNMTAAQVEKHCHDLTGRLNITVGGNVSLCARDRFDSNSPFNLGKLSESTAMALNYGIKNGFSEFLPEGKFNVGCGACFCNNFNRTMRSMVKFIKENKDAEAKIINQHQKKNAPLSGQIAYCE